MSTDWRDAIHEGAEAAIRRYGHLSVIEILQLRSEGMISPYVAQYLIAARWGEAEPSTTRAESS